MKVKTPKEIREKKARIAEKLKARNLERKTKKQFSRSKLIKEADRVFSLYIRGRDSWKPCCTCGARWDEWFNCGHFMSRRHYHTRWTINNAHGQCPRDNLYGAWEQYKHAQFIDDKYWVGTAQKIHDMAMSTDKISDSELLETIQNLYRLCFELWLEYSPKKQFANLW